MSLRTAAWINQMVYLGLLAGWYYFFVHMKMHQVQLDPLKIETAIQAAQEYYNSGNNFIIQIDDPALQDLVTPFGNRVANLLSLAEVKISPLSDQSVKTSDFEHRLLIERGTENRVIYSNQSLNELKVVYKDREGMLGKVEGEVFDYITWINKKDMIGVSKKYANVLLKFIILDRNNPPPKKIVQQTLSQGNFITKTIFEDVKTIYPSSKVDYIFIFNTSINRSSYQHIENGNLAQMSNIYQTILNFHNEELAYSERSKGPTVLIEFCNRKAGNLEEEKKYRVYRDLIHLKVYDVSSLQADVRMALQVLLLQMSGLDILDQEYQNIYKRRDFDEVIRIRKSLEERRAYKRSLVGLKSIQYVNNNLNFKIKPEEVLQVQSKIETFVDDIRTKKWDKLEEIGRYIDYTYFYSTYMFEQYVWGLLILIFISGLSPFVKFLKEKLILLLFFCRKNKNQKYLARDIGGLSSIDWFFERSVVALDERELLSLGSDEELDTDKPDSVPNKSRKASSNPEAPEDDHRSHSSKNSGSEVAEPDSSHDEDPINIKKEK